MTITRRRLGLGLVLSLGIVVVGTTLAARGGAQRQRPCHPSYPDTCLPPAPPDLNCGDLDECDIRVVGSDPHHLDRDHDGIGCECR